MSVSFNFVTTRLATGGGIETPADVDALLQAGVTAVIDCRAEVDDKTLLASHPDILYLWNGVVDDGQPKPVEWFQTSLHFAWNVLPTPTGVLYAHCAAGVNRGPSTAYAILRSFGLTKTACLTMIHTNRPETALGIRYANDADAALKQLGYRA